MALEIHDLEYVCSACGGYKAECQDDDAAGWYEADTDTICYRLAARQEYDKSTAETPPDFGTVVTMVDTRVTAPTRDS